MFSRRGLLGRCCLAGAVLASGAGPVTGQVLSGGPEEWIKETERMKRRMLDALPYRRIVVPGSDALSEWRRLRKADEGWPVVIGGDEDLDRIAEQYSIDDPAFYPEGATIPLPPRRSSEEILRMAAGLSYPDGPDRWEGGYLPEELTAPDGEWPSGKLPQLEAELVVAQDILARMPREKVHILLVPAEEGWQVPAHLRWGGWNACPPPEYHVAALRMLNVRYGAELASINGDVIEVLPARHPASREEALSLARELYSYCPDNVDQGTGTLATYAFELMASPVWTFWWD